MKIILIVVAVLTLLLGWLGLRVKPRPLPAFAGNSPFLRPCRCLKVCRLRSSASIASCTAIGCR